VKQIYSTKRSDPYFVEQRSQYALDRGLYDKLTCFDGSIALDRFRRVLGIQDMNAIENMFGPHLKVKDFNAAFKTYNQLVPLQEPDRRHIAHLDWLANRPEFDDRLPGADPTMANCGLTRFKHHSVVGKKKGDGGLFSGRGQILAEQNDFSKEQFENFRYGVLGLGEEALVWYYNLVNPNKYDYCRKVFDTRREDIKLAVTRNGGDWATTIALCNKLKTRTHRDESDIPDGLAGVLQFRDARRGFFAFPNWRLLLEMKAGCAQLFNFARLWHFNTEWEGFCRDVLVYTVEEGLRGYAHKLLGTKLPRPQPPDLTEDERKLAVDLLAMMERRKDSSDEEMH
jgi:hypothetical protein